jgi:LPS-assembly lipoprotein
MQAVIKYLRLLLLLTMLSLTGCGFHLRGHEEIPVVLQKIYIQSDTPFATFEQVLRDSLRSYNIQLVDTPSQANVILNITNVALNSIAGSVSSDLTLRQYTLNYQITYQVLSPKGKVILPTNVVISTTTFTSNMSQMMLSSKNSTEQYMTALQHDAVFRLMTQLLSTDSRERLQHYPHKSS